MQLRAYRDTDEDSVLDLINADRLPGQPPATSAHLQQARAGRSTIDAGWWADLSDLHVDVLTTATDHVVGVVSYAHRARDHAGLLLWLHAQEDPPRVTALVHHVIDQLGDVARIDAFDFATALTLGLEALPVTHRATTTAVLRNTGFAATDAWRYMHHPLPAQPTGAPSTGPDPAPILGHTTTMEPATDGRGYKLAVLIDNQEAGYTQFDCTDDGIGVLWWLGVAPDHRGTGVGRALLLTTLAHLVQLGATHVILYVDDHPRGHIERAAANHLYDSVGFVEIDRLATHTRPGRAKSR